MGRERGRGTTKKKYRSRVTSKRGRGEETKGVERERGEGVEPIMGRPYFLNQGG